MRHVIFPLSLLFVLRASLGAKTTRSSTVEDESRIKQLLDEYGRRWSAGDFEHWLELWTEDGVQMPDGKPTNFGIEAIRADNAPALDQFAFDLTTNPDYVVEVFGDTGYVYGTYQFTATPKGEGEAFEFSGKYLVIVKKQTDGSWKIAIDCYNSNNPHA